MGKGLSLWEDETVERLGCVLVVSVVLRMFRSGWEEGTLQEGMRSLGSDESLHRNVTSGLGFGFFLVGFVGFLGFLW